MYQSNREEQLSYSRVFVVVDALDESSSDVNRFYQDVLEHLPFGKLRVMVTSRERPPEACQGIQCDVCGRRPLNIYFRCQGCQEGNDIFDICYSCKDQDKTCGKSGHKRLTEPYEGGEVFVQVDPSDQTISEYVRLEIHEEVQRRRPGRPGPRLQNAAWKNSARARMLKGS